MDPQLAKNMRRLGGASVGALLGYLAVKYGLDSTDKGAQVLATMLGAAGGALTGDVINEAVTKGPMSIFQEGPNKSRYTPESIAGGGMAVGAGLYTGRRAYKALKKPIFRTLTERAPKLGSWASHIPGISKLPVRIKGNPSLNRLARRNSALAATILVGSIVATGVTGGVSNLLRPRSKKE